MRRDTLPRTLGTSSRGACCKQVTSALPCRRISCFITDFTPLNEPGAAPRALLLHVTALTVLSPLKLWLMKPGTISSTGTIKLTVQRTSTLQARCSSTAGPWMCTRPGSSTLLPRDPRIKG